MEFPKEKNCAGKPQHNGKGWVKDRSVGGVGELEVTSLELCAQREEWWEKECKFDVDTYWGILEYLFTFL